MRKAPKEPKALRKAPKERPDHAHGLETLLGRPMALAAGLIPLHSLAALAILAWLPGNKPSCNHISVDISAILISRLMAAGLRYFRLKYLGRQPAILISRGITIQEK